MPEQTAFTRRAVLRRAMPSLVLRPETGPAGDVLVLVFLRGGMDGLHTVPAHADPHYRSQRPSLALPDPGRPNGMIDLDGRFGLHARLAPLQELFQAGRLAVVHACGSPDRTLSHFEAMQTMERGVDDGETTAVGWIARYLAATPAGEMSPLRAVAFGDMLPKSMQGALAASAVRSITECRLAVPEAWGEPFRAALAGFYAGGSDMLSTAGRGTLSLLRRLEALDPDRYRPEAGARYPETEFGRGLRQVAQLVRAEVGLEIAEVDLGGWDAHAAQSAVMDGLMSQLAEGLAAFALDLGDRMARVTLVALSEFGRRVHENSSLGTDHGRGTAMLLLGGGIRGGRVYGRWPGLAPDALDSDGNIPVTTDYRDVLSEVVERRLRCPAVEQVFPGYTPRPLGITV